MALSLHSQRSVITAWLMCGIGRRSTAPRPTVHQPRPVLRWRYAGDVGVHVRQLPSGREMAEGPQAPDPFIRRDRPLPPRLRHPRRNASGDGPNRRNDRRARRLAAGVMGGYEHGWLKRRYILARCPKLLDVGAGLRRSSNSRQPCRPHYANTHPLAKTNQNGCHSRCKSCTSTYLLGGSWLACQKWEMEPYAPPNLRH